MKRTIQLATLGLGVVLLSFKAGGDGVKTLDISPNASKIEWVGEKITGSHNGLISLKGGSLQIDGDKIIGGTFEVDMNTMTVEDLQGEYADKLLGHLKSGDFFAVQEFATASFSIDKVESKMNGKFNTVFHGQLTIKGQTHPISFPAKVEIKDGKLAAFGEIEVDRTKYDIHYGSSSFFENLGDKAISDDFKLMVSLGAKI